MRSKSSDEVTSVKPRTYNAVEQQHNVRCFVVKTKVYDSEIVVSIKNIKVFDNFFIGYVALTEACCLVENR